MAVFNQQEFRNPPYVTPQPHMRISPQQLSMTHSSSHPSTSPLSFTLPPAAAAADNGVTFVTEATQDNFLQSSPSMTPTTHPMNDVAHSPPSIASLTTAGDNRARFATTQDIANKAANSNFPAFTGPGALMNLIQRFNNEVLPGNINENFNVNDFILQTNANLQSNGLRPVDGRMSNATGNHTVIVENRPPFDKMYFFIDKHSGHGPASTGFSVMCDKQAATMRRNGFIELHFTHLPRDNLSLPVCIPSQHVNSTVLTSCSLSQSQNLTETASILLLPHTLVLPNKLPAIDKKKSANCAAMQVISWVEEKVVLNCEEFPPMYIWSESSRKTKAGDVGPWTKSISQDFNRRMRIYVYILQCNPFPTTLSYTDLRSCADTWAKGKNLSDDGGEVCKRRLDDYWFKMAEPIAIKRQNNKTS